jgi:general secretion pathway protein D
MHIRAVTSISRIARALSAAIFGIGLCTLVLAQQPEARITLNMRNAEMHAVLQWIAEATGKRIVVDPRVRGNITILARDPMTPEEAFRVVITAINVYGYTAIEQDGVLQIVPAANMKTGTTQVLDALQDPRVDMPVNEVITLANLPAEQVANTLRPLIPAHASLVALAGSNSLLLTDTATNVQRIVRLARELDRSATLELDVVALKHAAADEVTKMLQQLLPAESSSMLQLVTDQRSNAILMAGSEEMRAHARQLLARLDQPDVVEGSVQVVYLHYMKAADMAPVLRSMVESAAKDGAPRQHVAIEPSDSTNALVISAPPDRMEEMLRIISKLDIRRAQVLVEAIIAEVDEKFAQDLGVEWKTSFDGEGVEAITRFANGQVTVQDNPLGAVAQGLSLGYFRNGSLRALLRALETTQNNNILSTPSIVTVDNQEAEILVGSNVPFVTGQSTGAGSPTTNPFTTIERQDIGVTLKVTPQINRGDAITLGLLQQVETLTDSTIAEDVVTEKRSIRTTVILRDNDILVLGGLIQNQNTQTVNKVPLLGDLPLLGALFRSKTDSIERKNLMVFVRTRILDDTANAETETRERYNLLREAQQDFNDPAGSRDLRRSSPRLPPLPEPASSP